MKRSRGAGVVIALLAGAALHADARAGTHPLADVPFSSPQHQIVVRVSLGKEGPFAMLLDTGTDPSVIDASLARRLRAVSDATLHEGEGVGLEKVTASGWDMVDLKLGRLRVDTVSAAALDLGRISDMLGTHIDGVLGYSFLEGSAKARLAALPASDSRNDLEDLADFVLVRTR